MCFLECMELFPKEDTPQQKVPEKRHEKTPHWETQILSHKRISFMYFLLNWVTTKILFNHCSIEIIIGKGT